VTDVTDSLYRPYTRARVSSYMADVSHLSQARIPDPQCPHCGRKFTGWHLAKRQ
jgi:hypothetical protein